MQSRFRGSQDCNVCMLTEKLLDSLQVVGTLLLEDPPQAAQHRHSLSMGISVVRVPYVMNYEVSFSFQKQVSKNEPTVVAK